MEVGVGGWGWIKVGGGGLKVFRSGWKVSGVG